MTSIVNGMPNAFCKSLMCYC